MARTTSARSSLSEPVAADRDLDEEQAAVVLAAVVRAVGSVYDEPVDPTYDLRGADSVDLVEIVLQTEAALREAGLVVRVDDDTLAGWADVAAFAGNVRAQLSVSTPAAPAANEQHGVDRSRS